MRIKKTQNLKTIKRLEVESHEGKGETDYERDEEVQTRKVEWVNLVRIMKKKDLNSQVEEVQSEKAVEPNKGQ